MLSPELCKKLKEAGFPQNGDGKLICEHYPIDPTLIHGFGCDKNIYLPSLSELIEGCKTDFFGLNFAGQKWEARFSKDGEYRVISSGWYNTPEEALANLYLEIHKN